MRKALEWNPGVACCNPARACFILLQIERRPAGGPGVEGNAGMAGLAPVGQEQHAQELEEGHCGGCHVSHGRRAQDSARADEFIAG